MNYGEQVLSRLMNPGVLLLGIGAVTVYGSSWIVQRIAPNKGEQANLICKAIGIALAIIGTILTLGIFA